MKGETLTDGTVLEFETIAGTVVRMDPANEDATVDGGPWEYGDAKSRLEKSAENDELVRGEKFLPFL